MTMSRGQFIAVTVALAAAVMAGAGYLAYAAVGRSPSHPQAGIRSGATGAGQSPDASPVTVPTTSNTAGDTPASATATASAPGPSACGNADITVSLGQGQGAAGHVSVLLLFTNDSASPCTLHGYPGAELQDPTGALPPLDAVRRLTGFLGGAEGMTRPPVVKLAAGQSVSAVLEWSDVSSSSSSADCYTGSDTLEVTPPNATRTTALNLGSSALVCGGFQVHPVLPLVGSAPSA